MKQCGTLVGCLPLAVLLCAGPALAAGDCAGGKPWVALSGNVPAAFAEAVRSDLRAGLAPNDIDVCSAGATAAHEPLARVSIETSDARSARFHLNVTDSVTQQRNERELSLDKLPVDGRAFALAVAVEELLRASWADSALRGVHSPQTAAPPEVRAVAEVERRPPPRFVALGARFAFERFLGGQTHYGADLFGSLPLSTFAAGLLAVGARRALSEQAPHGAIGARGFSAELGFSLTFLRRGGLDLGGFVSERLLRLSFEPESKLGAASRVRKGFVVSSRAGLGLVFGSPGLLRSYTTLGAGVPLKSFSAADGNTTVTGASELELFATTGLALELR